MIHRELPCLECNLDRLSYGLYLSSAGPQRNPRPNPRPNRLLNPTLNSPNASI
jgi:hypothetical protein